MKHNEKYHLWLGHYDSMEEHDKYIDIDGTTQTSQLAIDLGFPYRDKELDEVYGLTCLQPDFRYSLPLSELFFDMPVLEKDMQSIGDIYRRYSDKPLNTYIFLFNDRLQFQSGGVFEKYFYIGLFDADKSFDAGLL